MGKQVGARSFKKIRLNLSAIRAHDNVAGSGD